MSLYPSKSDLRALARRDPALGDAMKELTPFPGYPTGAVKRWSNFHALGRSIIYQQLAGAAALAIYGRVCRLTPGPSFPKPVEFLSIPEETVRGAGLSAAKYRAITDLSTRVVDGSLSLRGIARHPDEVVIEKLTQVWGIGEWSAQMFLMFKLGRPDVMAGGDLGLQEGLKRLDGLGTRPKPAELLDRAEAWRPLRTVAAWYLWRLAG